MWVKKNGTIILLLFAVLYVGLFLSLNRKYFLKRYDFGFYSMVYSGSQYVLGPASKRGMGDDGLYSFAGYYYFFQGGDVSSVNFEHPPLGKYLIGLSIFLFGNQNVINVVYFALLLFVVYLLADSIVRSKPLALFSVAIISSDPLYLDNLIYSLLDLPFSLFFLLGVYCFIRGREHGKYYIFSNMFFGAAFSTRFFPFLIVVETYLLCVVWLTDRKKIRTLLLSMLLIPIIYLLTHISFFVHHPSFVEFIRHKKWMLTWYTGTPIQPGNMLRNIVTGYYIDSTGYLAKNEYWTLTIPIVTLGAIVSTIGRRKEKIQWQTHRIVWGLFILYLLYISILTGGVQKFYMPIYPLAAVFSVATAHYWYNRVTHKKWNISNPLSSKKRS